MIENYAQPETIEALDGLIEVFKQDYQRLWLYTGENRVGKSTIAFDICQYITKHLNSRIWISFFFKTYNGEADAVKDARQDLGLEKTNIYPASTEYGQTHGSMYDAHDVDEAVHDLHMSGSMARESKIFLRNYDIYGKRRYFYNLIMPEFEFIKAFRNKRSHMWIHIADRGIACFHKPAKTFDEGIPIKTYSSSPMWIEYFEPLDPEIQDIYEQVKEYMLTLDIRREEQTEEIILKQQLDRFKDRFPQATQKDLAYILDLSQSKISRLLNAPLA